MECIVCGYQPPVNKVTESIGYHTTNIPKGTLGEVSKIEEELAELKDAMNQGSRIMAAVECADLIGAIEEFARDNLNMTIQDLIKFSDITKRAFRNGARK